MLSRKILHRNLALLLGLALLGSACLWGLARLHWRVSVAVDEYTELRLVENAALRASAARGFMQAQSPNEAAIGREVGAALRYVEEFTALQARMREGSDEHEEEEGNAARQAADGLRAMIGAPAASRTERIAAIDAVLGQLNGLAHEADELVGKVQQQAARNVRNTIIAVGGLIAAIMAAAIVISIRQYRDVIGPLSALSKGVRDMAQGNLRQRLPEDGDREFAELAHDFNRMSAELDDLYRSLEERVASKSRELAQSERLASVGFLAAGVAHEINNPLNIITGYAELSLKRCGRELDNPALQDAASSLRIIREEAFRCKAITGKLLSLSKPGDGARQSVSLARLAREVVDMMRGHRRYAGRRLEIDIDLPDDALCVEANGDEIKQVLLNLIVNALDATDPEAGEVRVRAALRDGCAELSVADNGCGMTPEVRQRIFEPFYSAKRDGPARGVGLGLSISHAIITGHRGRIIAESDGPSLGSRFTVQLPSLRPGDTA